MLVEQLFETRQAFLYHGTSLFSASRIVSVGAMYPKTEHQFGGRNVSGISLSRSLRTAETFGPIVFVFDQHRLRMRHPLLPIDYWHKDIHATDKHRRSGGSENEEFVIGGIPKISQSLVQIQVSPSALKDLQKFREQNIRSDMDALIDHPLLQVSTGTR